jgi:hypothetical protein
MRPLALAAVLLAVVDLALLAAWLLRDDALSPETARAAEAAGVLPADSGPSATPPATQVTGTDAAAEAAAPARDPAAPERTAALLHGAIVTRAARADGERGAYVTLLRGDEQVGFANLGSGSAYAFAGLAPGRYTLMAAIPDQLPLEREVDVRAPRTRCDLEPQPAWLLRVDAVTPGGEPLLPEFAKVVGPGLAHRCFAAIAQPADAPLAGDLPPTDLASVRGGIGEFSGDLPFEGPPLPRSSVGMLALPPDAPVAVTLLLRSTRLATELAQPGQGVLTFVLTADALKSRLARIRLRVVDGRTGAAASTARVGFSDAQTGAQQKPVDADGRIVVEHLKPGRLRMTVAVEGLAAPPVEVEAPAGGDLDLGDVVLQPTRDVAFAFEPADVEVALRCIPLDAPSHAALRAAALRTGRAHGTASLRLYPGRYAALAGSAAGAALVEFDTRALPEGPLRIVLRPTPPLVLKNEVGPGFASLVLRNPQGIVVAQHQLTGRWQTKLWLPAGEYTAEVVDITGARTTRAARLGPDGATLVVP